MKNVEARYRNVDRRWPKRLRQKKPMIVAIREIPTESQLDQLAKSNFSGVMMYLTVGDGAEKQWVGMLKSMYARGWKDIVYFEFTNYSLRKQREAWGDPKCREYARQIITSLSVGSSSVFKDDREKIGDGIIGMLSLAGIIGYRTRDDVLEFSIPEHVEGWLQYLYGDKS